MKYHKTAMLTIFTLLAIVVVAALTMGRYHIGLTTLGEIILGALPGRKPSGNLATPALVLWSVRIPRVIISVMVGSALAVSGAVFQGLFRNPLVSPGILGVTSGASFGATLAILLAGDSALAIGSSAFVWGLIAVSLSYVIGRKGGNSVTSLVLAGVIISTLFTAGVSFIKYKADPYLQLPAIVFWTMGSFNSVIWADAARSSLLIAAGLIVIYILRWWLNPMALGDEDAMALGVDVSQARIIYIFISTLIVAASVSACGNIGWVGLVVPHMARLIVGADHDILIPFSALLGGLFMLVMDTMARILPGGEIPVGILTSLVGAPFFAYLLISNEKKGTWQS